MPEFGYTPATSATQISLAQINTLKNQGFSNNQVIQALQKQGYTSSQIFDALNQASAQPSSLAQDPVALVSPQPLNTRAAQGGFMDPPMQFSQRQAPPMMDAGSDTEEMIEAIIDEKWNDLLGDMNKVIAWKEATDARLAKMEQQMQDMKDSFDKLQQAVVGKVGEYDQHILEVGAEVKAMEKVFSKVLPVFTDNVVELSRVTEQLKRAAAPPSPSPPLRR